MRESILATNRLSQMLPTWASETMQMHYSASQYPQIKPTKSTYNILNGVYDLRTTGPNETIKTGVVLDFLNHKHQWQKGSCHKEPQQGHGILEQSKTYDFKTSWPEFLRGRDRNMHGFSCWLVRTVSRALENRRCSHVVPRVLQPSLSIAAHHQSLLSPSLTPG